jgi:SAM-dependent methyltransferase
MMSLSDYGTHNEETRDEWIKNRLGQIPKDSMILDAGAGDQHNKKYCEHLIYTSQDLGDYNGKGNGTGLQTGEYQYGELDIISDICHIPRKDEFFDAILCTEVLEHIIEPELAIMELARLLKPGGKLFLTAPFCSLTHFAPMHYFTGFNAFWYQKILPEYKLKILELNTYGNYFEYLAQEMHRMLFVAGKYCKNPEAEEFELDALETVVNLLEKFGQVENHSYELLNFGFLVVAEKEGDDNN